MYVSLIIVLRCANVAWCWLSTAKLLKRRSESSVVARQSEIATNKCRETPANQKLLLFLRCIVIGHLCCCHGNVMPTSSALSFFIVLLLVVKNKAEENGRVSSLLWNELFWREDGRIRLLSQLFVSELLLIAFWYYSLSFCGSCWGLG